MIAPTRASHKRICKRMRAGLASLTVTRQQALYLTVVERRPVADVARTLNLPYRVAESIAAAARTKLYQAVA
jgi:DNA-directed RNA polymerase specialized sigma24 family protein